MVQSCSAVGCTNRQIPGSNITFHRIPSAESLRQKWLQAIRRLVPGTLKPWEPPHRTVICSQHFKETDFFLTKHAQHRRLKEDAIPSIFSWKLTQEAASTSADDSDSIPTSPPEPKKTHGGSCCVAWGCSNRSNARGKSFHAFPKDDERRKLWTVALRRKNFQPTKFSKLCSDHFEEACFDRMYEIVRLKDTAVPTLFNFPVHLQKEEKKARKVLLDRSRTSEPASSTAAAPQPTTSEGPEASTSAPCHRAHYYSRGEGLKPKKLLLDDSLPTEHMPTKTVETPKAPERKESIAVESEKEPTQAKPKSTYRHRKIAAGQSFHEVPEEESRQQQWFAALKGKGSRPTTQSKPSSDQVEISASNPSDKKASLLNTTVITIFKTPARLTESLTETSNDPAESSVVAEKTLWPSLQPQLPQPRTSGDNAQPNTSRQHLAQSHLSFSTLKRRFDEAEIEVEKLKNKILLLQKNNGQLRTKVSSLA